MDLKQALDRIEQLEKELEKIWGLYEKSQTRLHKSLAKNRMYEARKCHKDYERRQKLRPSKRNPAEARAAANIDEDIGTVARRVLENLRNKE